MLSTVARVLGALAIVAPSSLGRLLPAAAWKYEVFMSCSWTNQRKRYYSKQIIIKHMFPPPAKRTWVHKDTFKPSVVKCVCVCARASSEAISGIQ